MYRREHIGSLALLALLGLIVQARGEDWSEWRGPDRNGLSNEKGLLSKWPEGGPKLLWKATGLKSGFSTPSIARGKIYVLGTEAPLTGGRGRGVTELLIALDANGGKRLWSTPIGGTKGGHPSPRSTPTVDGERIYALSSDGNLVCASADKGEKLWTRNLPRDFGGKSGGWAYAESPLIDGDKLICTPGGPEATLVALDKTTGELIWKASLADLKGKPDRRGRTRTYHTAAYSSAIVAEVGGVRQYIQFLAGGVVGISAEEGKLLWHYDNPANGTANCSTPVFHDGCVFAASAYGTGGGLARITATGDKFEAREVYFQRQMQNHHGGMVLVGDHLYGTNNGSLLCLNFKTGEVAWQARSAGKGSLVYADGHLYVRGEGDTVALVEANPKEYKEKGRFKQPDRSEQRAWPHPVVANGKLYLRDWDILLCYDISGQ
jgi:outer membrane protein assembly factor BamB